MSLPIPPDTIRAILGCEPGDYPQGCLESIQEVDSRYQKLSQVEWNAHLLHVLRRIHEELSPRKISDNLSVFEQGWNENYELCLGQGLSSASLRPRYVKPFHVVRLCGEYIHPHDPYFSDRMLSLAIQCWSAKYLTDVDQVYEFGCGTGRYLFQLAGLFPGKRFVGLDWTRASQRIINLMTLAGLPIRGQRFNMMKPLTQVRIEEGSGVLTIGAMEQLGDRYQAFLDFLLSNQPRIVMHFEPIEEFYDQNNIFDYVGWLYHRKRGYLRGYWTALQSLERQRRITILEARRLGVGDPYHESSSLIIWQPTGLS
ncbi:MAG: class I SAM-dependent methyltransferase [Nitrospira sp.]|nr:class I SAM-dependent methyltransferase [Nitrospira sp.]